VRCAEAVMIAAIPHSPGLAARERPHSEEKPLLSPAPLLTIELVMPACPGQSTS